MEKQFKDFLKTCDFFGTTFNFHYKTKEKYNSITGGVIFLIYLLISVYFIIINFVSLIRRENMNIISYKTQTPSTEIINFKNYSLIHAFGLKCAGPISGKEYDYFKLFVNHVELTQINGKSNYYKTPINYSLCTKEHFNNQFNDSIDSYGLNQRYCFDDNNITIRGLYSEEIYQFVELTIAMTKTEKEDYETYYDLLTTNDCTFQLYHTDYGIDIHDFNNPVIPYIRQEFLKLSPIEFNKMEIYYLTQEFMSDKNYLFNNYHIKYFAGFSMFSSFSLYKGSDRLLKKPDDYDKLGKFFLRADTGKSIILRKYMKFTEFLANVSSLISGIFLLLFSIVGRINKFYSKEKLMTYIFHFKDDSNQLLIKKFKQNINNDNENFNAKKTNSSYVSQKTQNLKNQNNLMKFNKLLKYNNYTNKESITTEEFINNTNNIISNYLSNIPLAEEEYIKKKSNTVKSVLSSSEVNSKIHFKFNCCEILFLTFCPFLSWKKLKSKNILFTKGEKGLYLSTDILSYTKNMQTLQILTYLLFDSSQIQMLKFLSKPVISLSDRNSNKEKNNWKLENTNQYNEKENEFNDFCQGYKKIKSNMKKTEIDVKLFNIANLELNNLI